MDFPFGAIASGIGGVLSSLMSNNSSQRSIDFQRRENALNREFNASEAYKQRQFQRQMFDAENAYNDPKRVVSRLMSAGINPAVAFGNFANSASVSGGSAASYGNGVNPPMPDWSGIQSAGRAALDNEMIQAQIKLAESQANKNNAETSWIDRLYSLEADFKQSGIDLNLSLKNKEDKNAEVLGQTLENLKGDLDNIRKNGELIDELVKQAKSDTYIKQVAARFEEDKQYASLRESISRADLNQFQVLRGMALVQAEVKELLSRSRLNNSHASLNDFENAINKGFEEAGIKPKDIATLRRDVLKSQVDVNDSTYQLNSENTRFSQEERGWQSVTGTLRSISKMTADLFK